MRLLFNPISGQFEYYDPVSDSAITAERLQKTFISDESISAMKLVYASADGEKKFVTDFIKAWSKVMELDRFDI